MSPRHMLQPKRQALPSALGTKLSKDRKRYLEDHLHHPMRHPIPHPRHHAQPKPRLGQLHNPHCRPHGEELGPHTNQPGPIRFSKIMTKTGAKIRNDRVGYVSRS
ncbi:MAG TPA: hypothetical protein VN372_06910 [Methanospirillum sp.]|nr:hypothetical protein [Methanospirillum sp.]